MANEIIAFYPSGSNLWACVRSRVGKVWNTNDKVFETWDTATDYDITMTDKSGSMYLGDFPTDVTGGYCYIQIFERIGAAPADDDPLIIQEYCDWNGTTLHRLLELVNPYHDSMTWGGL